MLTNRKRSYLSHVPRALYIESFGRSPYFLTAEELRAGLTPDLLRRHRRALRRHHRRRLKNFTAHRSAADELTRQMNHGHLLGRLLLALGHPFTTLRCTLTRSARLLIGNHRRIRLRRMCAKLHPTA